MSTCKVVALNIGTSSYVYKAYMYMENLKIGLLDKFCRACKAA